LMSIKLHVLHDGAQLVVINPGFFSHSPLGCVQRIVDL
jgi:hypothetical protein